MAATMAGTIDLDKVAKYPIVLSDELRGRGPKEVFTGIRYNQRPPMPTNPSLISRELKPSVPGDKSKYDLTIRDDSEKYEYQGTRLSGDGQYILVFDANKKQFVLHQVDSTFDMTLSAPASPPPQPPKPRRKSTTAQHKPKPTSTAAAADNKRRKPDPKPKKPKKPLREPTPDAEDEDSDDGLTVEYPGGKPPPRYLSHPASRASPLPQFQRRAEPPSEESDADAEYEDDDEPGGAYDRNRDVDVLMLPSPAAGHGKRDAEEEQDEEEEEEEDLDLAAELEQALEKETGARADESSESEEE